MSSPLPTPPNSSSPVRSARVSSRPGLVARWRLSEPVRLYLWSLGSVLLAGLVLAGVLSGDWAEYGGWALGVLLAVGGGAEAARASVYSTNGHVASLLQRDAAHRLEQAAGW